MDDYPSDKLDSKIGLFELLAELRTEIYYHALVIHQEIRLATWQRHDTDEIVLLGQGAAEPALLRTCRQIRREALPVFYGVNVFRSFERLALTTWLSILGPKKAAMLKQLRGFSTDAETIESARDVVAEFEDFVEIDLGTPLGKDVFRSCFQAWKWSGREYWASRDSDVVWVGEEGKGHTVGQVKMKDNGNGKMVLEGLRTEVGVNKRHDEERRASATIEAWYRRLNEMSHQIVGVP